MNIDKGIPVKTTWRKYRFEDMAVGDSVFFDNEHAGSQSRQAIAARNWGLRNGAKFSCRKEGAGVRIWRVA